MVIRLMTLFAVAAERIDNHGLSAACASVNNGCPFIAWIAPAGVDFIEWRKKKPGFGRFRNMFGRLKEPYWPFAYKVPVPDQAGNLCTTPPNAISLSAQPPS